MPILEAFSANCPVVASYNSSIKEIGENAILYFDPLSAHSMSTAIEKVIYGAGISNELRIKGALRFKKFSIQQLAKNTLKAYTYCLNSL